MRKKNKMKVEILKYNIDLINELLIFWGIDHSEKTIEETTNTILDIGFFSKNTRILD